MSLLSEVQEYRQAFKNLGKKSRGMSPNEGYVLILGAKANADDRDKDKKPEEKGWIGDLQHLPPVIAGAGQKSVRISDSYEECREFWEIDSDFQRARITSKGMEFVESNLEVYKILKRHLGLKTQNNPGK